MSPPTHRNISPSTLILAIALFIFVSCSLTNRIITGRPKSKEWDLLIFTQNWPNSVCLSWEEKTKGNTCLIKGNVSDWTIHGIWPTKLGTIGPSFCDPSRPFSPEAVYGIEDQLDKVWLNVEKHKKRYMFWAHEWDKHGTCAAVLPSLNTEFDFFYQGIRWYSQYNMTGILNRAKILPGKAYNISDIWSGVKEVVGKNPHITCFTDRVSKLSYLLEIELCFTKQLELTDCDGTKLRSRWDLPFGWARGINGNFSTCSLSKLVAYPAELKLPRRKSYDDVVVPPIINFLRIVEFLNWMTS